MKPCHYVKGFNGERVLIPGCMGAAVKGKDGCTCNYGKHQKDKLEELEKRIEKLEKK